MMRPSLVQVGADAEVETASRWRPMDAKLLGARRRRFFFFFFPWIDR
jgi:hypothetical protein